MRRLPGGAPARITFVFLAVAAVLMLGASVAGGSLAPLIVFGLGALLVSMAVGLLADRREIEWLRVIALGAFALRSALAASLVWLSLARGDGGFTTGDDRLYANAGVHLLRYLQGDPQLPYVPPDWGGEYFLMHTYAYIEALVFWVFGPHVLGMLVVNAVLGTLTMVLAANVAHLLFGRAASVAAAVVLTAYPSLVLWSALNLRDAAVIFGIVAVLWALHRFSERPAFRWIVSAILVAWVSDGLRKYVAGELLIIILLGIAGSYAALSLARRAVWLAATAVPVIALLIHLSVVPGLMAPLATLGDIQNIRSGLQVGRTAFGTPPPPASAPVSTALSEAPTPASTELRAGGPPPAGTSVPTLARPSVSEKPVTAVSSESEGLALSGSLSHLPVGAVHALFAPFPWAVQGLTDLATVPETLLWYVIVAAMCATLWLQRARWYRFLPELMLLSVSFLVLSLAEGNVGTLIRHRAMVIPSAVVLASPGLAAIALRSLSRSAVRHGAASATS